MSFDKIKSYPVKTSGILGEEKFLCFEYVGKLFTLSDDVSYNKVEYSVIMINFSRNKKIKILVDDYKDQLKLIKRNDTVRLFFRESNYLREKYGEEFQYILFEQNNNINSIFLCNSYNNILYFLKKHMNFVLFFFIGPSYLILPLFFDIKDFSFLGFLLLVSFIFKAVVDQLEFKW